MVSLQSGLGYGQGLVTSGTATHFLSPDVHFLVHARSGLLLALSSPEREEQNMTEQCKQTQKGHAQ